MDLKGGLELWPGSHLPTDIFAICWTAARCVASEAAPTAQHEEIDVGRREALPRMKGPSLASLASIMSKSALRILRRPARDCLLFGLGIGKHTRCRGDA